MGRVMDTFFVIKKKQEGNNSASSSANDSTDDDGVAQSDAKPPRIYPDRQLLRFKTLRQIDQQGLDKVVYDMRQPRVGKCCSPEFTTQTMC